MSSISGTWLFAEFVGFVIGDVDEGVPFDPVGELFPCNCFGRPFGETKLGL